MTEKKISPLQRHAQLVVASQIARSKGLQIPPQLQRELVALETYARANFTPQQAAQAAQISARYQSEYQEAYGRSQIEERNQRASDAAEAKLAGYSKAAGLPGKSRAEIAAIAKGEKIEPQKRVTQSERDAVIREQTRGILGKGLTEAQWAKRLNELSESSPAEREAFAKAHKVDANKLNTLVTEWDSGGYLQHGLDAKRRARDEHVTKVNGSREPEARNPSDHESRRARIVETISQVEADELDAASERHEVIDDEKCAYDNERGIDGKLTRRGVMAQALREQQ